VELHPNESWTLATLGEAELILGRPDNAREWYLRAIEASQGKWRELNSMRRQLRILCPALQQPIEPFNALFPLIRVAVVASSRSDAREVFRRQHLDAVREECRRAAGKERVVAAYLTPISAFDIAAGHGLLAAGAEVHLVLPYSRDLCEASFRTRPSRRAFQHLMAGATSVLEGAERSCLDDAVNVRFSTMRARGMGALRASSCGAELRNWAVHCSPNSLVASIVDTRVKTNAVASRLRSIRSRAASKRKASHQVLAMLFADVHGYSRLDDVSLYRFSRFFLRGVAATLDEFGERILSRRTAGDGLFLVFTDLETAAEAARALRDKVARTSWLRFQLPAALGMRISLDAGPVYRFLDPIMQKHDFCGAFVNRAARIEPITPPNEIYASEEFASLYTAQGGAAFRFDYVGQTELPKGFGFAPLYHLNSRAHP
jgi:class 3 adenylate cyclase